MTDYIIPEVTLEEAETITRRDRLIDEVIKASVWPQSALTDKRSRATVGEWLDAIEAAVKVADGDEQAV